MTLASRSEARLLWLARRVRERFVLAGFGSVESVPVVLRREAGDGGRHVARYDLRREQVELDPRLARFKPETQAAVVAHEFGHAVDEMDPGRWRLAPGLVVERVPATAAHLSRWSSRTYDEVERTADAIAERALGCPIGYRGPLLLQTVGEGVRPRPRGLR